MLKSMGELFEAAGLRTIRALRLVDTQALICLKGGWTQARTARNILKRAGYSELVVGVVWQLAASMPDGDRRWVRILIRTPGGARSRTDRSSRGGRRGRGYIPLAELARSQYREVDHPIRHLVRLLHEAGLYPISSCSGGSGHHGPHAHVGLFGGRREALKAIRTLRQAGYRMTRIDINVCYSESFGNGQRTVWIELPPMSETNASSNTSSSGPQSAVGATLKDSPGLPM